MIDFINPETERIEKVKPGSGSAMLFFSPLFGVPLFFRKMFGMGTATLILAVAVAFSFLCLVAAIVDTVVGSEISALWKDEFKTVFLFFLFVTVFLTVIRSYFSLFLGVRANRITAKRLYKNGWKILPVDDRIVLKNMRMALKMPRDAFCDKDDIFSLTDGPHHDNISGRHLKHGRVASPKPTVFE